MTHELAVHLEAVRRVGFAGPVRVMSPLRAWWLGCWLTLVGRAYRDRKDAALHRRAFRRVAGSRRIAALAAEYLGADAEVWGVSVAMRRPGVTHHWHADSETTVARPGRSLSLWIGLHHTGPESKMYLYPGSHEAISVQEALYEDGLQRSSVDNEVIAAVGAARGLPSGPEPVVVRPGEAVLFDGRTWHGTHNSSGKTRRALIVQCCAKDEPIRAWQGELNWPLPEQWERPVTVPLRTRRRTLAGVRS